MDNQDEQKDKDIFQSIGTPIAALSLLYALIFVVVENTTVNAPDFWKSLLIFTILLITFFFSVSTFGYSQTNKSEYIRTAGLFMIVLWFVILFYLQNVISKSITSLFTPFANLGQGWFLVIPLLGLPIFGIIFSGLFYRKLDKKGRVWFWIFGSITSIIFFLLVKVYTTPFVWVAKEIVKIQTPALQIILAGFWMGLFSALIVAPIVPILRAILKYLVNFPTRKKMGNELDNYMKDLADAEKTPVSREFPFDLISKRVSFLIKSCDIIDNHPDELEESYKKAMKERGFQPCAMLTDYIVLDINLFYELAEKRFPKIKTPSSRSAVERFRHNILGHFQRKDNKGIVEEYRIINAIGLQKIYQEWLGFRDQIFKKLK